MSTEPTPQKQNQVPRRFLIGGSAVVAAAGVSQLLASPAEAATGTTAWVLGGNTGVTTDGSNFLGTLNAAPLIFKTAPTGGVAAERMRIQATGVVGIGTTAPACKLDVRSSGLIGTRATSTSTATTAIGVQGVSTSGTGVNGNSTGGTGVLGISASSFGVKGTSPNGVGVAGVNTNNSYGVTGSGGYNGVYGSGGSYGGIFYGNVAGSYGAYTSGDNTGTYAVGNTYGVQAYGATAVYGSGATGVYGSGSTEGITGTTSNVNGNAVHGVGGQYGVHGESGRTAGVRGDSGYVGVWGQAPSFAVYGLATDTGTNQTYGVFGAASNAASFAVWASGNCHVTGTLSKAAGSFKIDHPQDPANKWLSHSFVESPDMMNVYNGNVTLDANGSATVALPSYFGALNRDFRYQLTCIGGHAPVYVSAKVKNNAFSIAGGTAGLEVSWQVTGIRQDDYAKEHPIVVEASKRSEDRGTRQFVPKGSSAKKMTAHPFAAAAKAVPAHVAPQAHAPRRPAQ